MFRTLVAKEIHNNLLNYRFMLAFVLCTALLVSSAGIQYADYLARKHDHETNTNYYRSLISGPQRSWGNYFESAFVSRSPQLLSVFASGAERDPATTANIGLIHAPDLKAELHRNPLRSYFPMMDAVFVVGIVLSLLIFVLTFDTLAGERNEGTLKVLMAGPVPRDALFIAKWVGGMVCLVTPLLVSMLLMAVVVLFSGATTISSGEWWRMLAMAGVCTLYVAVVFSLAMMVSVVARKPATVMLALLAVWAVFMVAIPSLSTPLSYVIVSPPSVEEAETLNHRDLPQLLWTRLQRDCQEQEMAARGAADLPAGLARDRLAVKVNTLCFGRVALPRIIDTLKASDEHRDRAMRRVEQGARWISRLSSYGCLQNACVTLTGTGLEGEEALREALYTYQTEQREYYLAQFERSEDNAVSGAASPVFRVRRNGLGTDLSRVIPDAGILALTGVLFLLVGYASFLRSEIA